MNLGSVLNSTTLLDASGLANWTVALVALLPALSRGLGQVTDSPRTGNGKRAKKRKATSEIVHTGRIADARSRTGANPQGVSEEEERTTRRRGKRAGRMSSSRHVPGQKKTSSQPLALSSSSSPRPSPPTSLPPRSRLLLVPASCLLGTHRCFNSPRLSALPGPG